MFDRIDNCAPGLPRYADGLSIAIDDPKFLRSGGEAKSSEFLQGRRVIGRRENFDDDLGRARQITFPNGIPSFASNECDIGRSKIILRKRPEWNFGLDVAQMFGLWSKQPYQARLQLYVRSFRPRQSDYLSPMKFLKGSGGGRQLAVLVHRHEHWFQCSCHRRIFSTIITLGISLTALVELESPLDEPPESDEPTASVCAPVRPRPHLNSGAIALREPDEE